MPSKECLIIIARSIAANYRGVQPDGSFPSWETLQAVYDLAMESPPDWNIQNGVNLAALKQGKWMRKDGQPGGTNDPSLGTSWCGIFATYVLRLCGVPVKWRAFYGITPLEPHLKKLFGFGNWSSIGRGDICVKGSNNHHFIVYERRGDSLYSYDGNLMGQKIGEPTYPTPVRNVHTIYRPLFE
jgi:hypothetical protein